MPPADARVRDRGAPGGAESHRAVPCGRQGDGTGVPGRPGRSTGGKAPLCKNQAVWSLFVYSSCAAAASAMTFSATLGGASS